MKQIASMCWIALSGFMAMGMYGCASDPDRHSDLGNPVQPPRLARIIPLAGVAGPVERNGISGRLDHLAYDASTNRLFLAGFSKGSLEVIDLNQGALIKSFGGIPEAQGVTVAPTVGRVFVASGDKGTVHAFDTKTLEERGQVFAVEDADNMRFDTRTGHILVGGGSKTDGAILELDPQTLTKVGETKLPSHAESFQCDPRSARVLANVPWDKLSDRDGIVVVADRDTGRAVATWELHGAARNFPMALDTAHGRAFVVTRKPAQVRTFDISSGTLLSTTSCVPDSDDAFFDAATSQLFVIGGGRRVSDRAGDPIRLDQPGAVDVFAVNGGGQLTKIASLPLPPHSRTGLLVPERRSLYVAVPVQEGKDAELREFSLP